MDKKGRVYCSGMKMPRTLEKTVSKHVEKWIRRKQSLFFLSKNSYYVVNLNKESERFISCRLQVYIGDRQWMGFSEGRTVQDAVLNTLKSLKINLTNRTDSGKPKRFSNFYVSPLRFAR